LALYVYFRDLVDIAILEFLKAIMIHARIGFSDRMRIQAALYPALSTVMRNPWAIVVSSSTVITFFASFYWSIRRENRIDNFEREWYNKGKSMGAKRWYVTR